jgi:hypothetical protein
MTGNKKCFSSLAPLSHKEYMTFGNDKKGKVLSTGIIMVNDYFTLNDVTLVDKRRYNLLSISQLVDADLDVLFCKSGSQVLDSSGKLVCGISRLKKVFQANFSFAQSFMKCFISQSSSKLWKWHRRLGHLSFDLQCQFSGLGLLRGPPLLKFESNFICSPYRHGKMISASHSLVNIVLVIDDDYSHYSWVFFLESKDEVFEHFQSLALRLNNKHPNCLKAIHNDNGTVGAHKTPISCTNISCKCIK